MIRAGEIQTVAAKLGVRDTQIEKDYVISWALHGIASNEFLAGHLVFKGGTVLKKVYFPDYRFSEDMDFTFVGDDFDTGKIRIAFEELILWVYEESRIRLTIEDETQHETGNYNFYLSYIASLGGKGENKSIKADISCDEHLYYPVEKKAVINDYTDLTDDYKILCYSLEESVAEKMRSLMQRTAPRDLYDVWYLFENEGIRIEDCIFAFQEKAKYKGLNPNTLVEIIAKKEKILSRLWKEHLSHQVKDLPEFSDVWRELGKHWRRFEKFIR
jgi:predicted nucleotidyltransferase component of viral defense system